MGKERGGSDLLLESAIIGTTAYTLYRTLDEKGIKNRKVKRNIRKKWSVLMDSIGNTAENKIEQGYEILEIFIKHYGFDFILSIPYGKKFNDVLGLIPLVESCYKANVMVNLSEDKNSAYIRVHLMGKEISKKDEIRFSWFKTFYNMDNCTTKSGETLGIDSIEEVLSPNKEVVGYRIKSKIPVGLGYEKIKSSYDVMTRTLGKCFFDFNFKTMVLETTIIHKNIEDNEKFIPVKVNPWEIYVAMCYDWKPIILNYRLSANSLTGGNQGTGKTVALIMGFINLCYWRDDFDLTVAMMGEKQDLRVFRDVRQCKYYANTRESSMSLFKYLVNEMKRRNDLFAQQKRFCFNIYEYNEMVKPDERLKVIHLLIDEIADFAEDDEIQKILWSILRKGRSSGIYASVATQRASTKNLDSEIKGQLANKIGFSQPNTASALTVMSGEDIAKRVMSLEKNRECLVDYIEGIKLARTLHLDKDMMEDLLKDCITIEDNKLNLDMNGNIIEKQKETPEITENYQETVDNSKKSLKALEIIKSEPRWKQKKLKKEGKDKK